MDVLIDKLYSELSRLDDHYRTKKYLLAVSGGEDSVCMLHLFHQSGLAFEVAHCNFNLRGEESDEDESFVRTLCKQLKVKGSFIQFNTSEIVRKNKTSIQEEARKLRYHWFNNLLVDNDLDYISTAHHQDDVIETFFINSVRGAGLKGLKSIPRKNKNVIRPLLGFSKKEIQGFIQENNYKFRQDSSNVNTKYSRNYLRHEVIPKLDNVHPNAKKGLLATINYVKETEDYLNKKIEEDKASIITEVNSTIQIDLTSNPSLFLLYTTLSDFGFTKTQVENLVSSNRRNAIFLSNSHEVFKEENSIVIRKKEHKGQESFIIDGLGSFFSPFKVNITEQENKELEFSDCVVYFDQEKIKFPLIIRKWKPGDVFFPFGMKGKQKLSDYFINNKYTVAQKRDAWVLESENKIVWIIGKRTDDRFRVTKKSKKIIKIETKSFLLQ